MCSAIGSLDGEPSAIIEQGLESSWPNGELESLQIITRPIILLLVLMEEGVRVPRSINRVPDIF